MRRSVKRIVGTLSFDDAAMIMMAKAPQGLQRLVCLRRKAVTASLRLVALSRWSSSPLRGEHEGKEFSFGAARPVWSDFSPAGLCMLALPPWINILHRLQLSQQAEMGQPWPRPRVPAGGSYSLQINLSGDVEVRKIDNESVEVEKIEGGRLTTFAIYCVNRVSRKRPEVLWNLRLPRPCS
jgi:hypothetical protein